MSSTRRTPAPLGSVNKWPADVAEVAEAAGAVEAAEVAAEVAAEAEAAAGAEAAAVAYRGGRAASAKRGVEIGKRWAPLRRGFSLPTARRLRLMRWVDILAWVFLWARLAAWR
jgi:hypothetical protein